MIICHIGSGASISAIKNGKSVDTSMGMTPLEGLAMGTRSGDIDPAIIEFICQKENISVSDMTMILNKKSGVLGLSGVSNWMKKQIKSVERKFFFLHQTVKFQCGLSQPMRSLL